ncbi:MAG: sortase [Candidatus Levyibacteriota bacterium]
MNTRLIMRFVGICMSLVGLAIVLYIFTPLILWQLTLAPVFAQEKITIPIPRKTFATPSTIKSLLETGVNSLSVDYNNAANWFPTVNLGKNQARIPGYTISIPAIRVKNAIVSTQDNNLAAHLVNYAGTAVPPDKGTAVVFGHSTLPSLFDPGNYKTIFANAHTLHVGDSIFVTVNNIAYTYAIFSITIVDADDTSVFTQNNDDSYLTIVTCTPPGTTWKRLVIESRLQKL